MAIIKFDNVSLRYPIYNNRNLSFRNQLLRLSTGGIIESEAGKMNYVTALNNVNFEINEGDFIGLVGHNGAGKTTLLRTMAGIYTPNSGTIITEGIISTLFEQGACMEIELSGYENIIRMCQIYGLSKKEAFSKISDIEDFTELGDFLNLPVRTYSTGMSMRLSFAVATAIAPEILLIDEIFGAGDQAFREKANKRLSKIINSSKIFVFASHSMDLIKKYCNKIFFLNHGNIEIKNISFIK